MKKVSVPKEANGRKYVPDTGTASKNSEVETQAGECTLPAPGIAVRPERCCTTRHRYAKIRAHHASAAVTALAAC